MFVLTENIVFTFVDCVCQFESKPIIDEANIGDQGKETMLKSTVHCGRCRVLVGRDGSASNQAKCYRARPKVEVAPATACWLQTVAAVNKIASLQDKLEELIKRCRRAKNVSAKLGRLQAGCECANSD